MQVSDSINDNFFVISSLNCSSIDSRLYGFAFFNNSFYINGIVKNIPEDADGTYINISRDSKSIRIQQDYNGGYGLYLYQRKGFFAISNSFQYLLDYLKNQVSLSVNLDFAKYFITDELSSLSVSETLINEVKLLSKDSKVTIDLEKNNIEVNTIIDQPEKIPLNTKKGLGILDKWHHKWQSLLVGLQKNEHHIRVDLTGGMDSRAAFSIFNSSQIDLNRMRVNTSTGKLHTHKEDFEIASEIADKFNFKLNKNLKIESKPIAIETAIQNSFYAKLGVHKQMYFRASPSKEKVFYFTGFGGECIRSHWKDPDAFIASRKKRDKKKYLTLDCESSIKKIISNGINEVRELYNCIDDTELMHNYYQNTRLRSHFGKNTVENFLGNSININPLMDRELQKIHTGDDTLLCVIYKRYLSQLDGMKFDSGRSLDKDCIVRAEKINAKFPYSKNIKEFDNFSIVDSQVDYYDECQHQTDSKSKAISLYQSKKIEVLITDLLGYEVYRKGYLELFNGSFIADRLMYSLLAVAAAQDAATDNFHSLLMTSRQQSKANNLLFLEVLDFFKTARVDIKNFGNVDNDVKITAYNCDCKITKPRWFNNDTGAGRVVEGQHLTFNLRVECIKDGELKINLKGIDARDNEGRRLPAWIDFTSFKINNQEELSCVTPVWHDQPIQKTFRVKDGQVLDITVEWLPHNYDFPNFIQMVQDLYKFLPFRNIKN